MKWKDNKLLRNSPIYFSTTKFYNDLYSIKFSPCITQSIIFNDLSRVSARTNDKTSVFHRGNEGCYPSSPSFHLDHVQSQLSFCLRRAEGYRESPRAN